MAVLMESFHQDLEEGDGERRVFRTTYLSVHVVQANCDC